MKITYESDGLIVSISDDESKDIHEIFEVFINILRSAGYQDKSIKSGINELNNQFKN